MLCSYKQVLDNPMEVVGITSSIREFCQRVSCGLQQATFEQKRQLVELLIDRVVVTNEEVEIRYVIPIRIKLRKVTNKKGGKKRLHLTS